MQDIAVASDDLGNAEEADAHKRGEREDKRGKHKHDNGHRRALQIVLERPLRPVEASQGALGFHEDIALDVTAIRLVHLLVRHIDL